MQPLPPALRELIQRGAFAHLATAMADGAPQVSPVWLDCDGDRLRVNSARGRVKDRNIRRNPAVALSLIDPENPYRFALVRGRVVSVREDGADEHIDDLAFKYLGQRPYPYRRAGEVRVIYTIEATHVNLG